MASSSASLSEPYVLAHTKRRLFPNAEDPQSYAVTDTQFSTGTWLAGEQIRQDVVAELAPFNHVQIGNGYPDLVGVTRLDPELLAVDRLGDDPPLVVVESKGYTANRLVDTERGIVQAYNRLDEANAAFLAAPADAITQTDETLARELNVGILGVGPGGTVEPAVVPRLVGHRGAEGANAIRFQASAQGVANKSFGLNHPKNYLGYALAMAEAQHREEADRLLETHVVGDTASARQGAAFLGLVDTSLGRDRLTPLGREVARFAQEQEGSVRAALERFADWKRTRSRFSTEAPRWGQLARRVVFAYPATQLLVAELEELHEWNEPNPTLVDLVTSLFTQHPSFTVELFIRGTAEARQAVLDTDGKLRQAALADGDVYHSPTVFQLKAMLYHVGLLTERGREPNRLDPETDVWALRNPVSR
ncbi:MULTISPECIES: hypothetical protein [unclassified Haladaptatus]|uniref:hypothetical protein n=1 Tax=unclassified Haladaptatus TaxID=2622732 RepID=UPI0023E8499D|nr:MULTISPECIES: hypothetical protein [unclassified Haladaptatus]